MKIVDQRFRWPRLERPFRLYLAQLASKLDPQTKRLKDLALKEKKLGAVLDHLSHVHEPFSMVVLPEIVLPEDLVVSFVDRISALPSWTIFVVGIELVSVAQFRALAKSLGADSRMLTAALKAAQDDQPVNACLIVFKGSGKKVDCFLQPKITHSKFQGALEDIDNLAQSSYVYRFHCPNVLSFAVVICSDLFNRQAGDMARIVDAIDYDVLKAGKPLDFLINIQYNPSPNSELFFHSLHRLYDDGFDGHGRLCVIFLNSILDGSRPGGRSKIMFHKRVEVPTAQPVKQLDAPVVGYELLETEVFLCCTFDHLPRLWERGRDQHPLHFVSWSWNEDSWLREPRCNMSYVMPSEKEEIREIGDYEKVAREFSRLGNFDQSVAWARRAEEHWRKEKRYWAAAENLRMIGSQYRHQGKFNDALKAYAEAEGLTRAERLSPASRLLLSRIKAGRVMVEKYILNGRCSEADHEYSEIMKELREYEDETFETDGARADYQKKVEIYSLHALRQQAEMRRILGRYEEALKLFRVAYDAYDYTYHEEKANAALGIAESLRMLERYDDSREKFVEVKAYARTQENKRLLARTLRALMELERITGHEITDQIHELSVISDKIGYLFGRIWCALLAGGAHLRKDPDAARGFFETARSMARIDGRPLPIEFSYALIGCAEAERLAGRIRSSEELFKEALKVCQSCGIVWSSLRVRLGLRLCECETAEVDNISIESPGDLLLCERVVSGKFDHRETIFQNMP